jgi:hypothetical protein
MNNSSVNGVETFVAMRCAFLLRLKSCIFCAYLHAYTERSAKVSDEWSL